MQAALAMLGYDHTYHGFDMIDRPSDWEYWEKAADAKWFGKGTPFGRAEYDEFLGHCAATTDIPAMFGDDMFAAYPEVGGVSLSSSSRHRSCKTCAISRLTGLQAKVVLVMRDVAQWKKSFADGIVSTLFGPRGSFFIDYVEPILGSRGGEASRKIMLGKFHASNAAELLNNAESVYAEHYETLRRLVPADQLLEYRLESGWEPLCAFLGKEVPREPFPRLNEQKELQRKIFSIQMAMLPSVLIKIVPLVACTAVAATGVLAKKFGFF